MQSHMLSLYNFLLVPDFFLHPNVPLIYSLFSCYVFFTLRRQMKETVMAEPQKLPETSEEVRRLKNHESFWSSNLLVAEDLDERTHFNLYTSIICT